MSEGNIRNGVDAALEGVEDYVGRDWGDILAYARTLAVEVRRLRLAPETNAVPDAWLVLSVGGWRYLSGGEGDARQRMRDPTDKLYPLYRGELKAFVQLCAPHGKDWLTCPECAKAAVNGNPQT